MLTMHLIDTTLNLRVLKDAAHSSIDDQQNATSQFVMNWPNFNINLKF